MLQYETYARDRRFPMQKWFSPGPDFDLSFAGLICRVDNNIFGVQILDSLGANFAAVFFGKFVGRIAAGAAA
ncbi:hypothetical protein RYX36_034608 [Vicia faba]